MENVNKLSLPATILVASIVLGGFYYMGQVNKQKSIEKQQEAEMFAAAEQNKREFTARQKDACLNIYKVEVGKWNNVNGWRYNELDNECFIQYSASSKKTAQQCDEQYKDEDGNVAPFFFTDWLLCKDGLFERQF